MEWKPIETAPKDGTSILVYDKVDNEMTTMTYLNSGTIGWWFLCVEGNSCDESADFTPTHWMELPEAPKESE